MSPKEVQVAPISLQPIALEPPIASEFALEKVDNAEPLERDESRMPKGIKLYAIMGALLIAEVLVGCEFEAFEVPLLFPLTILRLCSGPDHRGDGNSEYS